MTTKHSSIRGFFIDRAVGGSYLFDLSSIQCTVLPIFADDHTQHKSRVPILLRSN